MQVLWTLDRRGAERMVFDLARSLPERGFRVLVVAPGGVGSMEMDFRRAGISCAIGPGPYHRARILGFLDGLLEQERPAILHTHGRGDVWGGWLAEQRKMHPWVITAHGEEDHGGMIGKKLRGWALRRADRVVSVSKQAEQDLQTRYALPPSSCKLIRPGVDLATFVPRGRRALHDMPRFIAIGDVIARKDHWTLVKALAAVKRPWMLEIIGEGSLTRMVRREAEALGILPRVQLSGSTSHVAERLLEADVFCLPSLQEGGGTALLEAAASGVPALVSDLPLFHETFDQTSLLFVRPGHVADWTSAIERTLTHYDEALARAARAQAIVRETFALDRMADDYAELYRSLLR